MLYKKIKQISLLASSTCNLHCSYCYLHDQHIGDAYFQLNQKISQAWISGEYVENIKKVFKAIDCSPTTVTDLSFWGGEPLIALDTLCSSIGELISYFTNLNFIMIPTNWTIIKNLTNLLLIIDNALIQQNREEKLSFSLQLSIDGPPGIFNAEGHQGTWDLYRKNINTLCKELEFNQLKKINIFINIHPTASKKNIFQNLNTEEKIYQYEKYIYDFADFINQEAINKHIDHFFSAGHPFYFPVIATPVDFSVEDGIYLDNILKLSNFVQYKYFGFNKYSEHMYFHSLHNFGVHDITEPNDLCTESGINALTILHDGTICDCPCTYIQTFQPYLDQIKNNKQQYNDYILSILRSPYFINPIMASKQEKEYFDWYMLGAIRNNKSTNVSLAMALCQEMALSGQINYEYLINPEILYKNLYTTANVFSCPREQVSATKNSFLPDVGELRKYYNGAVHTITLDRKNDGIYSVERNLPWNLNYRQTTMNY